MPSKPLDFRFGVRRPDGYQSSVWKLWATCHGDVYAAARSMVRIEKYSFHASGICRSAFTSEYGIPLTMSDRAIFKWRRAPSPPTGSNGGSRVALIAFPTDFLSRPVQEATKQIHWIPAAPQSNATFVEFLFTCESDETVKRSFADRGERTLLHYSLLPSGEAFLIAFNYDVWENKDLRMPGQQSDDLLFSASDPDNTGRPVRIRFGPTPNDGDALMLRELGGYPVDTESS